jgi:hypothetical protein
LIDAKEIERARKQLDPKYFRQQFEASFEGEGLRVYDDFDPAVHILTEPWVLKRDWKTFIGLDLGWTHPTAIIWAQLSPDGVWVIFDELVAPHLRLEVVSDAMMGKPINLLGSTFRARVEYKDVEKIIAGLESQQSRQEAGGQSALSALSSYGVTRMNLYHGGIISGVHAVRGKLRSASGDIRLRIDPRCKTLINDFMAYQYPVGPDGTPLGELPLKDDIHDHTMDALRYMIATITPLEAREWRF